MSVDDKKDYLNKYRNLKPIIDTLTNDVATLKALSFKTNEINEEIKYCEKSIEFAYHLKMKIHRFIVSIKNEVHRNILMLKYLEGCTYQQIGDRLGYCCTHVQRIAKKAIEDLEIKELENVKKC